MRITVEEIILLLTISVGAFMEIFDITVANVALPTMMGVFGVDFNEISWVLTSYLIGAALFMPLTGILLRKFDIDAYWWFLLSDSQFFLFYAAAPELYSKFLYCDFFKAFLVPIWFHWLNIL